MNSVIRERKKQPFKLKRITPKIIRELADVVKVESGRIDESTSHYLMFSVDADDNSAFESESTEIFSENQIIEKKAVRKVGMLLYTHDNSKRIEFQAVHTVTDEKIENFLAVSGDDATWVNGIFARMNAIINAAENQSKFINQYSGWMILISLFIFNIYFFSFLDRHNILDSLNIFLVIGFFIATIILAFKLSTFINTLWPVVELQTGPDYEQLPSQKRKKVQWVIGAILLPLILSFVYDALKGNF